MKKIILAAAAGILLFSSCNKAIDSFISHQLQPPQKSGDFAIYHIKKGEHFATGNVFKLVETSALRFVARFDSSAIYKNAAGVNQFDINKLYGFSDNNQGHHQYSARFGWNWNEGALRLYAYVYNDGKMVSREMGVAPIGADIQCSIQVNAASYAFTMNDAHCTMPRKSTTTVAKGYMLYPYFGGDETAPHDINIWIKNL